MFFHKISLGVSLFVIGLGVLSSGLSHHTLADVPLGAATPEPPQTLVTPLVIAQAEVLKAHYGIVHDLEFSPDGKTLATSGSDGYVRLWDVTSRNRKATLVPRVNNAWSVQFSPDGKTLIVAVENGFTHKPNVAFAISDSLHVAVWDLSTGKLKRSFPILGTRFNSLAISPDAKLAVVCGEDENYSHFATMWEVETGRLRRKLYTEPDGDSEAGMEVYGPNQAEFAPDNRTVGIVTLAGKLVLWDAATGRRRKLSRNGNYGILFSPDGKSIISQELDKNEDIILSDAFTGKEIRRMSGHAGIKNSFAFSPDGTMLASGGDDENPDIMLWNLTTGKQEAILKGHTKRIRSISYSPDGHLVVSCSADGMLRFWELT